MRILKIPFLVLALVGLIAVSGCGGGSDSTSTSSSAATDTSTATDSSTSTDASTTDTSSGDALSADEYSQQAQTVLVAFGTQFTELGAKIQKSSSPAEFSTLVGQAETEIQGVIDDFGALSPPAEAQQGHDQILAALEDFSSKLTDVSDAAASGDKTALTDAATALQQAGVDFQSQLQAAAKSLTDAGINLGGGSSGG